MEKDSGRKSWQHRISRGLFERQNVRIVAFNTDTVRDKTVTVLIMPVKHDDHHNMAGDEEGATIVCSRVR